WNEGQAMEHVDLDPLDVISFPIGVARRFMNVTYDEPGREHLLMFIIGGNQPQAEFTPLAMRRCEQFSREQQRQTASRRPAPPRRPASTAAKGGSARSEERRVGKECKPPWQPAPESKKQSNDSSPADASRQSKHRRTRE